MPGTANANVEAASGRGSRDTSGESAQDDRTVVSKVISKDGTPIAFERTGRGAPLILVDGALCSRGVGPSRSLAKYLARHFTVFIYDRRGRGESGDTAPYAVEREIEDIDALIAESGRRGVRLGHVLGRRACSRCGEDSHPHREAGVVRGAVHRR